MQDVPDFGQLVEYITEHGVQRVPLSAHSLGTLPTLEAVRDDYQKVAALGRGAALDANDLAALRAAAAEVYAQDVIDNEIVSSDPLEIVTRLAAVRSYPDWGTGLNAVAGVTIVFHAGNLYRCAISHTVVDNPDWAPDKTPNLWVKYYEPEAGPQPWAQPTGAHDAYQAGDQVLFEGKVYESLIDANVWSPAVYGWTLIT